MAKLVVRRSFIDKRNDVRSKRARDHIDAMLRTIEGMPGVGSALVANSIRRRYGNCVLKALVSPYVIIYRYDRDIDTAYVLDLIDARTLH